MRGADAGHATDCASDAFTTSQLFENGTYKDARLQYGGSPNQADVSNSLLLLFLTQTQTFPSPSTASGFTFTLRGKTVPTLESELYGPLFGERALTNGLNQLSFTFNIHTLRWSSLDAADIRVGESGLLWGDTNYDSAGGGYVGICRMDINTTIGLAALNYGVLDNLDLSAAFPIVHTSVEGSNEYLDFNDVNGRFEPTRTVRVASALSRRGALLRQGLIDGTRRCGGRRQVRAAEAGKRGCRRDGSQQLCRPDRSRT